jgi:hypothetical protein
MFEAGASSAASESLMRRAAQIIAANEACNNQK